MTTVCLGHNKVEESIDLNGLVRLFVNHRPVFPFTKQVRSRPTLLVAVPYIILVCTMQSIGRSVQSVQNQAKARINRIPSNPITITGCSNINDFQIHPV